MSKSEPWSDCFGQPAADMGTTFGATGRSPHDHTLLARVGWSVRCACPR
jgi:hypothetical protein